MKHTLLYLLLLFSGTILAQEIIIPDELFKLRLLQSSTINEIAIGSDGPNDFIAIDANGDGILTQEEANQVYQLNISFLDIYSFEGIGFFTNLRVLNCHNNLLETLDVSLLLNLEVLNCNNNMLEALNVTALSNLKELNCNGNNILNLQIFGLTQLKKLSCDQNNLIELNLDGVENLENLSYRENEIAWLNFDGLQSLKELNCISNFISEIDLSALVNLEKLWCSGNNLTTLDLNNNTKLNLLSCHANQLVTLFMKNGQIEEYVDEVWVENPTLRYICADESQIAGMMPTMPDTVQVNSYCSYEPGGVYNSITGIVKFDSNNDGCDATDSSVPSFKLKISNGIYEDEVFTKPDGSYVFYVGAGVYTVTPVFENVYFTVPLADEISFPILDGTITPLDFCLHAEGTHSDIEVIMAPVINARPGFDAVYKIVYKNKGNQVIPEGSVTCVWDSSRLQYVSVEPEPNIIEPNTYTWFYNDLKPFESREVLMTLNVNSPTDTPAVNIDDILPFSMTTVPVVDETPADNTFVFNQVVVGSMDPNNIECIEGGNAPTEMIGEYLHYVINFENTGTAPTTFVVVQQNINLDDFDISTLQLINSSHDVKTRLIDNKVEFRLDQTSLGVADHGNILYKIKSKKSLMQGDKVNNQANIYFDYNFPIETNEASTLFETILGKGNFKIDNLVTVYPNPTKDRITISAANNINSIQLYDIQGRLLQTVLENNITSVVDLTQRPSGVYFLKVTTDKGVKIEKIIRE